MAHSQSSNTKRVCVEFGAVLLSFFFFRVFSVAPEYLALFFGGVLPNFPTLTNDANTRRHTHRMHAHTIELMKGNYLIRTKKNEL